MYILNFLTEKKSLFGNSFLNRQTSRIYSRRFYDKKAAQFCFLCLLQSQIKFFKKNVTKQMLFRTLSRHIKHFLKIWIWLHLCNHHPCPLPTFTLGLSSQFCSVSWESFWTSWPFWLFVKVRNWSYIRQHISSCR